MPSLMDWLFGDPYQSMMGDARRDNQARYGTNEDQPPLRSVDDPTPYKEFHDDRSTTQPSYTGGYPLGGGAPLSSLYRASSADNTSPFMNYIQQLVQQLAASVPMQDPGLRYQYAPPYSPQRTDPNYQQNWQQQPQYSPAPDDTLLGPTMQAQNYIDAPSSRLKVPPDSVPDSPRFLEDPDTGDETTEKPRSNEYLALDDWIKRHKSVSDEFDAVREQRDKFSPGSPEYKALNDRSWELMKQLDEFHNEYVKRGYGRTTEEYFRRKENVPRDADAIMQGIQQRQQQEQQQRQPTPSEGTPMSYLLQQFAALGGAPEWRPGSGPAPGGSRVPADFMYDQQPIPLQTKGPPPMTQPYWSIQGAERLRQARQAAQQANVPQDRAAITQGMVYGPQQLYGQQHLLPQYQSLGNIRPLGPGEFIQHPDPVTGQPAISSEETITVPYQGRWAVLPSLWMVNGKAMVVDENTAVQFAQQSGLNWPLFNSENEGNAWADQREQKWRQSGGRTDTQPPLWSRQFPSRQ